MTNELILILFAVLTISSSGLIINLTKSKQSKVVWQEITKTLLYFKIAVPLALILSIFLFQEGILSYGQHWLFVTLGITLIVFGLIIRWMAIQKLSGLFTVKISIMEGHKLITSGVYKYIRHPSYTGMIIYYIGLGLLMHNFISFGILIVLPLSAILIRIHYEEKALEIHFKDQYAEYKKKSCKLIPFIF